MNGFSKALNSLFTKIGLSGLVESLLKLFKNIGGGKLAGALSKLFGGAGKTISSHSFYAPTPVGRNQRGNPGSNNHGKGESKIRRRMAVKSNRINRQRIRDWKY